MQQVMRNRGRIFIVLVLASLLLPATAATRTQLARSALDQTEFPTDPQLAQAYQYWRAGQMDRVLALVSPLATQGNAVAEFLMGQFYSTGEGLPQNDEQALQWWRKAAEQGLARAQNELAVALTEGRGTSADPAQAVEWYRKAASQGLAVAQINLGLMYLNGVGGLREDDEAAVGYFRKAADQGMGWAQYYMGVACFEGRGVRRNATQAAVWYRKAAEQGYVDAEYALGMLYSGDGGVDPDYGTAVHWFALAAQQGNQPAVDALQLIVPTLTRVRPRAALAIRSRPDAAASAIEIADGREYTYVLHSTRDWLEVYLQAGHRLGYISTAELRGK